MPKNKLEKGEVSKKDLGQGESIQMLKKHLNNQSKCHINLSLQVVDGQMMVELVSAKGLETETGTRILTDCIIDNIRGQLHELMTSSMAEARIIAMNEQHHAPRKNSDLEVDIQDPQQPSRGKNDTLH